MLSATGRADPTASNAALHVLLFFRPFRSSSRGTAVSDAIAALGTLNTHCRRARPLEEEIRVSLQCRGCGEKQRLISSAYETRRSAILPILHHIQDEYEWIQDEHIRALETQYQLHRVQVEEVARFYAMYRLEEPKRFRVMVCDNIVCSMRGAQATMQRVKERIAALGEQSPFSVEGVPCLGVCDGAPAVLVNKDRYLQLDAAKADRLLDRYLEGEQG